MLIFKIQNAVTLPFRYDHEEAVVFEKIGSVKRRGFISFLPIYPPRGAVKPATPTALSVDRKIHDLVLAADGDPEVLAQREDEVRLIIDGAMPRVGDVHGEPMLAQRSPRTVTSPQHVREAAVADIWLLRSLASASALQANWRHHGENQKKKVKRAFI